MKSSSFKGTKEEAKREEVWARDTDLVAKMSAVQAERSTTRSILFLAYGSLGVIYGDIGTSLIYVFASVFSTLAIGGGDYVADYAASVHDDVFGAMSLIFWTITLIAVFKYVLVVLRANDTGEGGTVALYAQLCRTMGFSPFGTLRKDDHEQVLRMKSAIEGPVKRPALGEHRHRELAKQQSIPKGKKRSQPPCFLPNVPPFGYWAVDPAPIIQWFRRHRGLQVLLMFFASVATGLVIGDAILMPAFSVNSAISGIRDNASTNISNDSIVGISISIIFVLFILQHIGTRKIAWMFSPIIIVWLCANFAIGVFNMHFYGGTIWGALNPKWIGIFFQNHGVSAWEALGGVMLCVSGTETMFAAMGHFSQPAIAVAFGLFAYPCLIVAYLGQGAYLLVYPGDVSITFWASLPNSVYWPMVALATLAASVASQAVITGTFSILRQSMSLGIFPKLHVIHTDSFVEGQIFIPVINYLLMIICIAVIAGFGGDNVQLGHAYGVAVMMVMLITTLLVSLIMIVKWRVSIFLVVPFFILFFCIEGIFLSANLFKVPAGGWFTLVVAFVVASIMFIWWAGSSARRKVLLHTSKQQAANNLFIQHNPSSESRHNLMTFAQRGVVAQQEADAVTLTAAGYAVGDGPSFALQHSIESKYSFPILSQSAPKSSGHMKNAGPEGTLAKGPKPSLSRFSDVSGANKTLRPPHSNGNHVSWQQQQHVPGTGATAPPGSGEDVDPEAPKTVFATAAAASILHGAGASVDSNGIHITLSPSTGLPGIQKSVSPSVTISTGESPTAQSSPRQSMHRVQSQLALHNRPERPLAKLMGVGIYYSESPVGVPPVMSHFLKNIDALHGVAILLTVRFLPMPTIKNVERLLVRAVSGVPNFYQVVARYGYQDHVDHRSQFVSQVISTIMHKLELKAGLKYQGLEDDFIAELEGDHVDDHDHDTAHNADMVFGLNPVHEDILDEENLARQSIAAEVVGASMLVSQFSKNALDRIRLAAAVSDAPQSAKDALEAAETLIHSASEQAVYYLGRAFSRAAPGSNFLHNFTIGGLYRFFEDLSYNDSEAWNIPLEEMVELGMALEI
ncbi:hypothetical protein CEUSTIGMA_g6444.t1 [Chlamydomonas eustigma]|uniref:Potassium transporter n=1 Tax=Chlamydomonas eustigma TaxID=1157962 RepID=A0A250X7E2_9CHLO|nr:hypothetical protein CEUSTIGMA_g6444.t1 [Chlamydomonas eustigma]|eukprot:GAX79004.1 hypothetical protein CEUSTIGMA_g6444.t1 [Chlamydomonas eustigma]